MKSRCRSSWFNRRRSTPLTVRGRRRYLPAVDSLDERVLLSLTWSGNWSGYVAESNLNAPRTDSVTAVSGSWVVPKVSSPSGTSSYSCVWVGIDGYGNGTVEQIGTEQDVGNGGHPYYAWWEMYSAGNKEPQQDISNMTILPGDSISASVQYITSGAHAGQFFLSIVDTSRANDFFSTYQSSYQTQNPQPLRNSAEWIVEDTEVKGSFPKLANFGTVRFTNTKTTINGQFGPINATQWQSEQMNMASGGVTEATTSSLSTAPSSGTGFFYRLRSSGTEVEGGGFLYAVQNGTLFRCPAGQSNWSAIASDVTSFALTPSGSTFFVVSGGELDSYTYGVGWNWNVASDVTSFALTPSGSTFFVVSNGELDSYTYGVGWNWNIASGVTSFALTPSGSTFFVVSNGVLDSYTYGVGWNWNIASGVTSFALTPSGSTFFVVSNGELDSYTYGVGWNWNIASGVTSFALTPSGSTFFVVSNGVLDSYTYGVGWNWDIASNVTTFALSPSGSTFYVVINGVLDSYTSGVGWEWNMATGVVLLSQSPATGTLYILEHGGALEEYAAVSGWSLMMTGVENFVMGFGGFSVDILQTNGSLWKTTSTSSEWMYLDQGVQAVWLVNGGYVLEALQTNGAIRTFTA